MNQKSTALKAGAGKAVATPGPQGGALAEYDPELLKALGSETGALTDLTKEDVAIPFLTILQPLSKQVTPGDSSYIEGAKPGQILQTVTKEVFAFTDVLVCDYRRSFIEWVPRDKGGGFRGEHGPEYENIFNGKLDRATGKAKLENGHDLVDTRSFYLLVANEDGMHYPAICSMASSQVKKAKTLVNLLMTYVPPGMAKRAVSYPAWAAVYRLGSVLESNDKGKWFGWTIQRLGLNQSIDAARSAEAFRAQIRGGSIVVDRTQTEELDPTETGGTDRL